MWAIARPLLFASIDPAVAQAAGVPTRLLSTLFLAVVGATVAEATQIIGALVVLGLLAAPAAAGARLTTRPWHGFWLSAILATAAIWIGVSIAETIRESLGSRGLLTLVQMRVLERRVHYGG